MKQTFSNSEDYKLVLEMEQDIIFLHIAVYNWGKSVLKSIREDMLDILERTKEQGWDEVYAVTPNVKFANMIEPCQIVAQSEADKNCTIVKWITG